MIDKPIEDHYILNIGDISDISKIMKSELMLNTVATLEKRNKMLQRLFYSRRIKAAFNHKREVYILCPEPKKQE